MNLFYNAWPVHALMQQYLKNISEQVQVAAKQRAQCNQRFTNIPNNPSPANTSQIPAGHKSKMKEQALVTKKATNPTLLKNNSAPLRMKCSAKFSLEKVTDNICSLFFSLFVLFKK